MSKEKKTRGWAVLLGLGLLAGGWLLPLPAGAVSGISSGKCVMPWARTLSAGSFQFEPAVTLSTATRKDVEGEETALGGRARNSGLGFRLTAGVREQLELGAGFGIGSASFHPDEAEEEEISAAALTDLALGAKYRFFGTNEGQALALEAGVTLPWVSEASYSVWEAGLVYSLPLGSKWSLDADATGYLTTQAEAGNPQFGSTFNLGIGVAISASWLLAAELNGSFARLKTDGTNAWKLTPTVGLGYGLSPILAVCAAFRQDVPGLYRNSDRATAAQLLFTFTFENKKGE